MTRRTAPAARERRERSYAAGVSPPPPTEPPAPPTPPTPATTPATTAPAARVVAVVSAGGVVGSLARWGLATTLPGARGSLPWATLTVNVVGSLLLGLLLGSLTLARRPHPLLRPALGTGVLGGFTTFSTFSAESRDLLATGHPATAAAYVALTLVVGLLAALLGLQVAAAAHRTATEGRRPPGPR